jgi:hypothetical protein
MEQKDKEIKMNCWEFKNCDREPGGRKVHELGECPAATEAKVNGIHGGKNGGRCCWAIVGTLCKGEVQGTFVKKYSDCQNCDFYKSVRSEEIKTGRFMLITDIAQMLGK